MAVEQKVEGSWLLSASCSRCGTDQVALTRRMEEMVKYYNDAIDAAVADMRDRAAATAQRLYNCTPLQIADSIRRLEVLDGS